MSSPIPSASTPCEEEDIIELDEQLAALLRLFPSKEELLVRPDAPAEWYRATCRILLLRPRRFVRSLERALEDVSSLGSLDERSTHITQIQLFVLCEWLACGGEDPERAYPALRSRAREPRCSEVWKHQHVAYRCLTCQLSDSSCLCVACFEPDKHLGHDYRLYESATGGCCDCGDEVAWRKSGFCSKHSGSDEVFVPSESPEVEAGAGLACRVVTTRLLSALKRGFYWGMMRPEPQAVGVVARVVEWLTRVATKGGSYLRYAVCQALMAHQSPFPTGSHWYVVAAAEPFHDSDALTSLMRACIFVDPGTSAAISALFLHLLFENDFKTKFTNVFVLAYPEHVETMLQSTLADAQGGRVASTSSEDEDGDSSSSDEDEEGVWTSTPPPAGGSAGAPDAPALPLPFFVQLSASSGDEAGAGASTSERRHRLSAMASAPARPRTWITPKQICANVKFYLDRIFCQLFHNGAAVIDVVRRSGLIFRMFGIMEKIYGVEEEGESSATEFAPVSLKHPYISSKAYSRPGNDLHSVLGHHEVADMVVADRGLFRSCLKIMGKLQYLHLQTRIPEDQDHVARDRRDYERAFELVNEVQGIFAPIAEAFKRASSSAVGRARFQDLEAALLSHAVSEPSFGKDQRSFHLPLTRFYAKCASLAPQLAWETATEATARAAARQSLRVMDFLNDILASRWIRNSHAVMYSQMGYYFHRFWAYENMDMDTVSVFTYVVQQRGFDGALELLLDTSEVLDPSATKARALKTVLLLLNDSVGCDPDNEHEMAKRCVVQSLAVRDLPFSVLDSKIQLSVTQALGPSGVNEMVRSLANFSESTAVFALKPEVWDLVVFHCNRWPVHDAERAKHKYAAFLKSQGRTSAETEEQLPPVRNVIKVMKRNSVGYSEIPKWILSNPALHGLCWESLQDALTSEQDPSEEQLLALEILCTRVECEVSVEVPDPDSHDEKLLEFLSALKTKLDDGESSATAAAMGWRCTRNRAMRALHVLRAKAVPPTSASLSCAIGSPIAGDSSMHSNEDGSASSSPVPNSGEKSKKQLAAAARQKRIMAAFAAKQKAFASQVASGPSGGSRATEEEESEDGESAANNSSSHMPSLALNSSSTAAPSSVHERDTCVLCRSEESKEGLNLIGFRVTSTALFAEERRAANGVPSWDHPAALASEEVIEYENQREARIGMKRWNLNPRRGESAGSLRHESLFTTCGHLAHASCMVEYERSLNSSSMALKLEVQCPMCRRVSNTVIPVTDVPLEANNNNNNNNSYEENGVPSDWASRVASRLEWAQQALVDAAEEDVADDVRGLPSLPPNLTRFWTMAGASDTCFQRARVVWGQLALLETSGAVAMACSKSVAISQKFGPKVLATLLTAVQAASQPKDFFDFIGLRLSNTSLGLMGTNASCVDLSRVLVEWLTTSTCARTHQTLKELMFVVPFLVQIAVFQDVVADAAEALEASEPVVAGTQPSSDAFLVQDVMQLASQGDLEGMKARLVTSPIFLASMQAHRHRAPSSREPWTRRFRPKESHARVLLRRARMLHDALTRREWSQEYHPFSDEADGANAVLFGYPESGVDARRELRDFSSFQGGDVLKAMTWSFFSDLRLTGLPPRSASSYLEGRGRRLIDLPTSYTSFVGMYTSRLSPIDDGLRCDDCGASKRFMLCLWCGRVLCHAQCASPPGATSSAVEGHISKCPRATFGSFGVYMNLQTTQLEFVHRAFRRALAPSLYLDAWNEEDPEMRRGRPLTLSRARFEELSAKCATESFLDDPGLTWSFIALHVPNMSM